MTPTHREWAGVSRYMASDASNSTTASTISETMIKRLMAVLLFRLAPRRAQAVSEKKQPCGSSYILSFPARQCRIQLENHRNRKAGRVCLSRVS
ncbi:hypothetical protein [Desulfovibrio sp. ZJ200]|uniref:hypothetical protein n=1 Tax=Desulfovibrio sp. ZJ200 TaxID=2709792 RepID=UPI0013EC8620|nr:hypothetical protein [Desulfovibrio sp. ZJ200]